MLLTYFKTIFILYDSQILKIVNSIYKVFRSRLKGYGLTLLLLKKNFIFYKFLFIIYLSL